MCNRYSNRFEVPEIEEIFDIHIRLPPEYVLPPPNTDIRPTNFVTVVVQEDGQRALKAMRWMLLPRFAKSIDHEHQQTCARADKLAVSPLYKPIVKSRRCLIVADAFCEWYTDPARPKNSKERKPKYTFARPSEAALTFAGVWDEWHGPEGHVLQSCAIVTVEPNAVVKPIHNRMPAVLDPHEYSTWLDTTAPVERALSVLRTYPDDGLVGALASNDTAAKPKQQRLIA